jgi:hypothetical protein
MQTVESSSTDSQVPIEYGTGESNSVALGDYGVAVEVHLAGNQLQFRVGSVEDDGTITWAASTSYGSGSSNSVAVDNFGNCVEVHAGSGATAGKVYYRVGKVDYLHSFQSSVSKIDFGPDTEFDAGNAPAVTLAANGDCLVVFAGTGADAGRLLFRGGRVNTATKMIEWYPRVQYDSGERAAVAMDDSGKSVELHVSGQHLTSQVGR